MNLFICNRIDNTNEDVYILTPNLPFDIYNDKYKLHYFKYNQNKSINLEKTLVLSQKEDIKKNTKHNSEESEELQIIDYPYKSQRTPNELNESFFYNSKITNSYIDNNSGVYNCLNLNNNDEKCFENKKAKKQNSKKQSLSFLSNSNIKRNYNESMYSDLYLEDTIKGEDNINISILKNENRIMNMNLKKQKNKMKKFENNIYSKNKSIPYYYKNNIINKNRLNLSKIENNLKINKKLKMNQPIKKLSNKKGIQNANSQKKENIKPRIKLSTSKNFTSNKKQNINNQINLRTNYKNYYNSSENNIFNYKNKSPINNRLQKTFSDNNIFNYDLRPREIDDSKRYINDSKLIIEQIKKKIKKKLLMIISKKEENYWEKEKNRF
jgi:hypothetical protein